MREAIVQQLFLAREVGDEIAIKWCPECRTDCLHTGYVVPYTHLVCLTLSWSTHTHTSHTHHTHHTHTHTHTVTHTHTEYTLTCAADDVIMTSPSCLWYEQLHCETQWLVLHHLPIPSGNRTTLIQTHTQYIVHAPYIELHVQCTCTCTIVNDDGGSSPLVSGGVVLSQVRIRDGQ